MKVFATLALVVLVLVGCERPLTQPRLEQNGPAQFALIGSTADSVSVSVRWKASTDPSGIHHYEWMDTLAIAPITAPAWRGTTIFLTDTITVPKPAINTRHEHDFYVRAVDNQGNIGPYSARTRWALTRRDQVGPNAPDSIFLDTLINLPIAIIGIDVLPDDISIRVGDSVDFCALMKFENGKTAVRAIDSFPLCLAHYWAKYPPSQRVTDPEQQATANAACVLWSATGGTIGQEPCAAATPAMQERRALLQAQGLLFNIAIQ